MEDFSNSIECIDSYFKNNVLPLGSLKLDCATTVVDLPRFVESHLKIIKSNAGNSTYLPYLIRLQKLKSIMESQNQYFN